MTGRGERWGTRSARVMPSSAPAIASRTRTQSRLTVQDEVRSQARSWLGVVGRADHRRERAFEGAQDLAHPDRLGRRARARSRRARRGCETTRPASRRHERELLEVGARAGPRRPRSRRGSPGPVPKCRPSWTISRTPYSPFVRERDGAGAVEARAMRKRVQSCRRGWWRDRNPRQGGLCQRSRLNPE